MPKVVGICSPRYLQIREYVSIVYLDQRASGAIDIVRMSGVDVSVLFTIKGAELAGNFRGRLFTAGVIGPQELDTLLFDKGKRHRNRPGA